MTNTLMAPGRKYWNNNASHTTWTDADKAAFDNKDFYPTSGSGYNNQKWATERNVKDEYEGYDFPIIRYAEVLLNYAKRYLREMRMQKVTSWMLLKWMQHWYI